VGLEERTPKQMATLLTPDQAKDVGEWADVQVEQAQAGSPNARGWTQPHPNFLYETRTGNWMALFNQCIHMGHETRRDRTTKIDTPEPAWVFGEWAKQRGCTAPASTTAAVVEKDK
jgi:hypothetical protein